jgi:glycosyltransferase involved in cell wall biosynthesis
VEPVPVLQLISRLNVGGPAVHVLGIARQMTSYGYSTELIHGREGRHEGDMSDLAAELGVHRIYMPALRREIGLHDLQALLAVRRYLRRRRPAIVHTHASKAGAIGRIAALLAGGPRPILVHTFHGHVFHGVFESSLAPKLFVAIERLLARFTTRLVAVSEEVRDDLVRYRVAPPEKIEVVRLGFELGEFALADAYRSALRERVRRELGIPQGARVVTVVARVVRMKRLDRFLRVAERLQDIDDVVFVVVGDGEQREPLERSGAAARLGSRLVWAGIRRDMPAVYAASDLAVLTSDNEGTPVAFIEAQAAGLPVVGTNVGGMAAVIDDGRTGRIVEHDDEAGLSDAIRALLDDPREAQRIAEAGQRHALSTFSADRLAADMDRLYGELIRQRAPAPAGGLPPAESETPERLRAGR